VSDRRVLVTGGNGFLGSHIVPELMGRGYDVTVVDNLSGLGSQRNKATDIPFLELDLRDRSSVRVFEGIDICLALAARCGGIGFFNRRPAEILDDNVRILSTTFEGARRWRTKRVVYVSSSCVFDRSVSPVATEEVADSVPSPPPGYPFSKLAGEHYCRAFSQQFGVRYTIIRPFNAYGPGEMPGKEAGDSHVIPDLTSKILTGQAPVEILGDGSQTRSFTYVSDIVQGIVLAMQHPNALDEDFNLGGTSEISIVDLARMLWEICGFDRPFSFKPVPGFPHDIARRAVDVTKAKSLLGWNPIVELKQGLSHYVTWLRGQMVVSR
jgi:UDP-glucose 4-epimerase